jgi:hypothetical protein
VQRCEQDSSLFRIESIRREELIEKERRAQRGVMEEVQVQIRQIMFKVRDALSQIQMATNGNGAVAGN